MKEFDRWQYDAWPFEMLDTMSFAEYREAYLEDVDRVKSNLVKIKSLAFKKNDDGCD